MFLLTQKIVELANICKSNNIHLCDLLSRDQIIVKYRFSFVKGSANGLSFHFCSIVSNK